MKKLVLYGLWLICSAQAAELCEELRLLPEVRLKYAQHFKLFKSTKYVLIKSSGHYHLKGPKPAASCLGDKLHYLGQKPVRFGSDSTSVYPWFSSLQAQDLLVAFSGVNYLQLEAKDKLKLLELNQPVKTEELLRNKIDLFFSSSPMTTMMSNLFLLQDFKEHHPLGRAEWLKVLGFLIGKDELATKYFDQIEADYQKTKALVKKKPSQKVLVGEFVDQVFLAPSPNSYLAQLIADAGGDYVFKTSKESSTLRIKKEEMMIKIKDKNFIYLPQNHKDLKELEVSFAPISLKEIKIFNNNKRLVGSANDYWQSGVNSPHLLLRDLIKIFHPEVLPLHEFFWYQELQ